MKNITVREWIEKFNHGEFDNEDFETQCAAGWYDWFCSTKTLAKKLKKMGNIIKDIKNDYILCKHWEKKEYKHMARGTMYELQREKDFLNQLQEEELYEHLPDIAEFVKTEKNKEGAACILLEEMQELGAVVGKEDDIPYIIFTKECKENYFRDRFTKVKKMVADMDLDEFSNSDLFTLRDTIQDNWGDMAYEDSMIPFDQFIRTAIPDAKYYIGNIIHLH